MKKIITPVDFSAVSRNAALYAANMAAYLNIPLVLIHVTELPISYAEVPAVAIGENGLFDDYDNQMQILSMEIEEKLKGQVTVEIVNRTGNPLTEISTFCNHTKAYALVIGTHGNTGLSRLLLGSTTLGVIKECHCPVLIVPNGFEFHKPVKIGLASDLHNVNSTIPATLVRSIVNDFGGKLEILHVDKDDMEEEDLLAAETIQINSMFEQEHPKIRILKSVFTEETLLNYAAEKNLDLLMVIPKKHNWIDLLVKHQHTKNIALHASVPVMVLKNQ